MCTRTVMLLEILNCGPVALRTTFPHASSHASPPPLSGALTGSNSIHRPLFAVLLVALAAWPESAEADLPNHCLWSQGSRGALATRDCPDGACFASQ